MPAAAHPLTRLLLLACLTGVAGAADWPAGWSVRTFELPACGPLDQQRFEQVQEVRDRSGRVQQLEFSYTSVMDAVTHLTFTRSANGGWKTVAWTAQGDWDFGTIAWTLGADGRVIRVTTSGQRDGVRYSRSPRPQDMPLPAAFRFTPSPTAYEALNCAELTSWPIL